MRSIFTVGIPITDKARPKLRLSARNGTSTNRAKWNRDRKMRSEDGRVCADAESEGENGDESKSRRFAELTQGETEVVHVIQHARLRLDRHGWRDAPVENTR
jgi:hypothetical protein